jgi:sugar/nucleoside kinase (ribokinase family)
MSTQTTQIEIDYDVLVHGAIGTDYLLQLDGIPPAGEVRSIEREVRTVGGEAANCAVALATWGARVCLCGNPVGNDSNGRFVTAQLALLPNLTLKAPILDQFETPYSVIMSAQHQPRAVLVRNAAAKSFDESSSRTRHDGAQDTTWPSARLATCDGNLPSSTLRLAKHLCENGAGRAGTPLFAKDALLNESVAPLAEVVLLSDAFWPHCNETQLSRLASERADEWGNTVVITRGRQGGVWCRAGEKPQRYAAVNIGEEDLLSSVGAGDVFRAGLLWSRLQGWEWEHGLRFAAAAAGLKCRQAVVAPELGQIEAIV